MPQSLPNPTRRFRQYKRILVFPTSQPEFLSYFQNPKDDNNLHLEDNDQCEIRNQQQTPQVNPTTTTTSSSSLP
jgi:hypothetical protein